MRTLLVLRHAKSSWDQPGLADIDRQLAPRGQTAAPLIGRHLRKRGWQPDLVICSPAARTQETWQLVQSEIGRDIPCKTLRTLYLAAPSQILAVIRRTPDDVGTLMVIGHNPGLERLAVSLSGSGDNKDLAQLRTKFPTAALAVITFDAAHWSQAAAGAGRLEAFVRPKDLG